MTGRTLVVTNDFPPRVGGIESFVLAMVRRMPADSVVVHTARQPGDRGHDQSLGFPVVRDPSRLMVPTAAIASRVVETARRHGCDSVWFGAAAPLGLLAARLRAEAGVRRVVATTHGHEVWWAMTPGTRRLLRRIGETTDVLTYLGDFTRQAVARALTPAAAARMVQLTPGVDVEHFSPSVDGGPVRAAYGLGDRPVVVCVARMVPRKGQDLLVRAWSQVREAVPGAALLLVGDGPDRGRLTELVAACGVGQDVVLAGAHPWQDLPGFFAAGDVFAMPCRTRRLGLEPEALGIVFLEASATGLPVVAGRSGGAPDAVRDGVTGRVVTPDVGSVADAVVDLLGDRAEAARLGAAGREWVTREWTWERRLATLRGLLDPGAPPRHAG